MDFGRLGCDAAFLGFLVSDFSKERIAFDFKVSLVYKDENECSVVSLKRRQSFTPHMCTSQRRGDSRRAALMSL